MKSLLLLVVDDSLLFTERMCADLKELNLPCIATTASTYDEAENILKQIKPDLIFLDINLGDRSGIELLKHIKATYPSSEVAILTNNSHVLYDKACEQAGAKYFLDKTFDLERVPGIIYQLMEKANSSISTTDAGV